MAALLIFNNSERGTKTMANPGPQTNTTPSTTPSTNGKTRAVPTAVDAISKISKILDMLSDGDRKRVLAFINASNE